MPPDGDADLLVRVLRDWPEANCLRILGNCPAALPAHARLLIVDEVIAAEPTPEIQGSYLLNVQVMAMFGNARERTEADFRSLLTESGFDFERVIPTSSVVSIIEAFPHP